MKELIDFDEILRTGHNRQLIKQLVFVGKL